MGIYILDGICIIIKNGPSTNAWTVLVLWRLFRHCRFHNDGIDVLTGHCEPHNDGIGTRPGHCVCHNDGIGTRSGHCEPHNDGIDVLSGHCESHNDGTRPQIPCRRLFSLHQFAVQRFEPRFDDFFTVTELVFIDDGFIFFKAFQQ